MIPDEIMQDIKHKKPNYKLFIFLITEFHNMIYKGFYLLLIIIDLNRKNLIVQVQID